MDRGRNNKKIIVCCDGTWQDADSGYTKPTLFPYNPYGVLQVPSNVVRISRILKRQDFVGRPQIISYHQGVGSGSTLTDKLTGGILGAGISEIIREAYSFICTNYDAGDEIVLIGFSRGAYTARSIAGMIRDIGLLTREGMNEFYAIFRDVQNSHNHNYNDIFPDVPFAHKPGRGKGFIDPYREMLLRNGMTRTVDPDGRPIDIQAVAVWDTVGSLGIPTIGWMQKLGFPHATKELKFFDTALSNTVRHAFQALALDEHRHPFAPAVWEKRDGCTTDLRQCWFAGAHSNVGGGYDDQEMANVTLAWMMDQLASIGLEFQEKGIDILFEENRRYYQKLARNPKPVGLFSRKPTTVWAVPEIYEEYQPVRPWALGRIDESETGVYHITGRAIRTPGLYKRADPDSGEPTQHFMTHTNERIHSSVRIRLELGGLDVDDVGRYKCEALLKKGPWELRQVHMKVYDPISPNADWGGPEGRRPASDPDTNQRWIWEYVGPRESRPLVRTMIEENLGPFERRLLQLNSGRRQKYRKRRRRKRPHNQ